MIRNIFVFVFSLFLCDYSFGNQECKEGYLSKDDFLVSYRNMCYYQIKVESEIISYANNAEDFGFTDQYLKILELAEQRGSVGAKFLLGRYFFEDSQIEQPEEQRLYKLAKGITKVFISAEKGLEKAKEYYNNNFCNSKVIKSFSTDPLCNQD
jgi:hypothetical protein